MTWNTDYDIIEESNTADWHILYVGQYRSAEFQIVAPGKYRITLMHNNGHIEDTGYINQSEKAPGILRNWVADGDRNGTRLYKIDDLTYWTPEVTE